MEFCPGHCNGINAWIISNQLTEKFRELAIKTLSAENRISALNGETASRKSLRLHKLVQKKRKGLPWEQENVAEA